MSKTQSAKCYSETSSFQRNSGYQFIQQLSLGPRCRVLDLGCGTGSLAAVLSECVGPEGKVIAVDPDGERLKLAKEKYARDNIEYVSGNDATYPEGSYDLIFAGQLVQWVTNKEALFRRVFETLKSGGRFAFTTANGTPLNVFPPAANDCMNELFGPDFIGKVFCKRMAFLTCDQYQELALSHGFTITNMEDKDVPGFLTGSVDNLIEFFFGLLHGELDHDAITEQALQSCKDKYEDDLQRQAKRHQTVKMLHVVLTKP